jgi:predicted enzyme related to lactoylglutathione lyase
MLIMKNFLTEVQETMTFYRSVFTTEFIKINIPIKLTSLTHFYFFHNGYALDGTLII